MSEDRSERALPRRHFLVLGLLSGLLGACSRPYRVGDYVLVEWGEEKLLYPAYITQKKSQSRFRVHFEGYPVRWDEDVTIDRIKGLVQGKVTPPPVPRHVRLATGMDKELGERAVLSRYKEGDRLRVRFRGSIYRAIVLEVISADELKIRYEGHEAAWDEVIHVSRIVTSL